MNSIPPVIKSVSRPGSFRSFLRNLVADGLAVFTLCLLFAFFAYWGG